jgi:outer membrane protein assembly factor BamB
MAIVNGRLFTQGQRGNQGFVQVRDTRTGAKVWETVITGAFPQDRGPGPRGTPTIDGDRLYALSGDGVLACLETQTGKTVWKMNLVQRFGAGVVNWGMSESPLVDGERLIVTPGGRGASVVALNKRDGSVLWKSQSEEAGYSSPVAFDLGGARRIVVFTGEGAMGLSASNGELLWKYNKVSNRTANIATPIYHNGHVFLSSDYGTGCALLRLVPAGAGLKAEEVYFNRDMRNHYSTSVLVGDYLYGFSSAILTAMKFQTGEVAWRDRSVGKGSVTYADGHLYCLSEDGVMGLVEATPAAYREKSRFQIARGNYPTWTPPVIADGRLYLREQDNLYCYNVRQ